MPAPDLDPLLAEYLKHEQTVRSVLGIDPETITGGAAHAALSEMLGVLQNALRETARATLAAEELLDELRELDRPDSGPEPTPEPTTARCWSVSDPVAYLDLGRARESRVRCLLPDGHDGEHSAVRGDGREHRWS